MHALWSWNLARVELEAVIRAETHQPTAAKPLKSTEGLRTSRNMREIVHLQAGQCGNQIGTKVGTCYLACQRLLFDKFFVLIELIIFFPYFNWIQSLVLNLMN